MYNGDYLEKILGEKYNIKNFYENNNDIISNVNEDETKSKEETASKKENDLDKKINIKKQDPIESFQYQYETEIKNNNNNNNNLENVLDDEKRDKSANDRSDGNENFLKIIEKDFSQFDEFYPDIYRILIPMIDVVIDKNKNKDIGIKLIEEMAREIYNALVIDVDINNKNLNTNENKELNRIEIENENQNDNTNKNEQMIKQVKPKNIVLLDLIKILILDKLKNKK